MPLLLNTNDHCDWYQYSLLLDFSASISNIFGYADAFSTNLVDLGKIMTKIAMFLSVFSICLWSLCVGFLLINVLFVVNDFLVWSMENELWDEL